MGAKITVIQIGRQPEEIHIGNTALVGRNRDNTICLAHCPQASRQHAVIRSHNAYQYQIMDLGSRNGTFVNGARVVMPVTLESGDTIRIGSVMLKFFQEVANEPEDFAGVTMAAGPETILQTSQAVSIMVCDICGFSTMSERLPEAEVARTLGRWFREAGKIVFSSGGTIDKFIGDALLAYWSAQPGNTTVAEASGNTTNVGNITPTSCDIAFQAGQQLLKLAEQMKWPGTPEKLSVRVALHFGNAICSNIGVMAERDATIIGDAVNTAFRIESVMKALEKMLVVSSDFLECLTNSDGFVDLGKHHLKGKSALVRVYSWG